MLLLSLVRFAEMRRLAVDPAFEQKAVDFVIQLDQSGRCLGFIDRREQRGSRLLGAATEIPRIPKRSVNISAGLLVDNVKYVLGIGDKKDKPERLARCAAAFLHRAEQLSQQVGDHRELNAVLAFLRNDSARTQATRTQATWTGSELVGFQVQGEALLVHQSSHIRAAIAKGGPQLGETGARCLVTGRTGPIARLHPSLKRVPDGQSSGTSLVSFNGDAFSSHGLGQGDNAPISESAAVAYVAALNFMLEETDTRRYRHGIRLGNSAVLVLWTDSDSPFVDEIVAMLEPPFAQEKKASIPTKKRRSLVRDSVRGEGSIELVVEAPWKRTFAPTADDDPAQVFGVILSGNAARAVVREAFSSTIADTKASVGSWFRALSLRRGGGEESPTIPMILKSLDPQGNSQLPPSVSSRLASSALRGKPLPAELLRHALLRFRRHDAVNLTFSRAAVIKACLVTMSPPRIKETAVSLDEHITDQAYLLGRLFAALEKAQENALPGLNATIRDRYFSAASTAPGSVFPRLLKLAQHHVSKAEAEGKGYGIARIIQGIVAALPAKPFPALFALPDQGMFAIGYYHQRDAFFTKKNVTKETAE